ncbi:peptide deformylase [Limimonas halophila]|uniref:Peptide deformylase n=1 Tax=Limimonas halophila TaxID=1082479 RepID=A0A1G7TJL5_9PROT|nr:peptide deformylase [Limimonas halophila]SDG34849.1 peptide deformylase [Limimonas halophila]
MAELPILVAPDQRLKKRSEPVTQVDDELRRLMDDMLETMYAAPGVGLAAPQVGVNKRVLVADASREGEEPQPYRMVNPEVVWTGEETETQEEGCLSLPEVYAEITRPRQATIRYLDENGAEQTVEAEGFLATVLQHEIDHLNGVLFIDYLSSLKKNMILRKLAKQYKGGKSRKNRAKETAA